MRESKIERHLVRQIKTLGGRAYKFSPAGHTGIPDRLCVLPTGFVAFIELKRPSCRPKPHQWREILFLRSLSHFATYVNTLGQVDDLIRQLRGIIKRRMDAGVFEEDYEL